MNQPRNPHAGTSQPPNSTSGTRWDRTNVRDQIEIWVNEGGAGGEVDA